MDGLNKTAFGDLVIAPIDVRAAYKFDFNLNPLQVITTTTTDGAAVTIDNNRAKLTLAAAANSEAHLTSKTAVGYSPGLGVIYRGTAAFDTAVAGSEQILGMGDTDSGFFFGYNGTSFGIMRRSGSTDTWTPSSDWSERDKTGVDDTLDPTNGNVYQINFQWLGYGSIRYFVEEAGTGKIRLVHVDQYANSSKFPSIDKPTLALHAHVKNIANTSALTMFTSSAMAGVEGIRPEHSPGQPLAHTHTFIATSTDVTSEVPILTLRCDTTFFGSPNKNHSRLLLLDASADGNKPLVVRGYLNATLSTDVSFTPLSTDQSFSSVDIAATTSTDGSDIGIGVFIDKVGTRELNLDMRNEQLAPGDTVTLTAESDNTSEVKLALTWIEFW